MLSHSSGFISTSTFSSSTRVSTLAQESRHSHAPPPAHSLYDTVRMHTRPPRWARCSGEASAPMLPRATCYRPRSIRTFDLQSTCCVIFRKANGLEGITCWQQVMQDVMTWAASDARRVTGVTRFVARRVNGFVAVWLHHHLPRLLLRPLLRPRSLWSQSYAGK